MQRYFYNMVYIVVYKAFCANVVEKLEVQGEVLLERRIKYEIAGVW